jgi:hypothetical protein
LLRSSFLNQYNTDVGIATPSLPGEPAAPFVASSKIAARAVLSHLLYPVATLSWNHAVIRDVVRLDRPSRIAEGHTETHPSGLYAEQSSSRTWRECTRPAGCCDVSHPLVAAGAMLSYLGHTTQAHVTSWTGCAHFGFGESRCCSTYSETSRPRVLLRSYPERTLRRPQAHASPSPDACC